MERKGENLHLQILKNVLVAAGITPEEIVLDYRDPEFKKIQMNPRLTYDLAEVKENWDLLL